MATSILQGATGLPKPLDTLALQLCKAFQDLPAGRAPALRSPQLCLLENGDREMPLHANTRPYVGYQEDERGYSIGSGGSSIVAKCEQHVKGMLRAACGATIPADASLPLYQFALLTYLHLRTEDTLRIIKLLSACSALAEAVYADAAHAMEVRHTHDTDEDAVLLGSLSIPGKSGQSSDVDAGKPRDKEGLSEAELLQLGELLESSRVAIQQRMADLEALHDSASAARMLPRNLVRELRRIIQFQASVIMEAASGCAGVDAGVSASAISATSAGFEPHERQRREVSSMDAGFL